MNQGLVAIARPSPWQHMQETQGAFEALVDEVRYYVLELLGLLNRHEVGVAAVMSLLLFALLRLEVSIHAHEASHSSNVLVREGLQVLQNAIWGGFGAHIEEDAEFRIELATEALEEPEVGGQFGAVGVFEAADDLEFEGVIRSGAPKVLVDEGQVLFDGRGEVVVVLYEVTHPLPLEVVDFVKDDVDPLVQVALLLALPSIHFPVEFQHRMFPLGVGPPHPILHQFEDSVLDEDDCDIVLADSVLPEWGQIRVDALKGGFDGVATLVVHADADDDLHALEVVALVLPPLGQLAQEVDQPVCLLEVVDLVLLGGVVVDDLSAVGGRYPGQVFAEGGPSVGHDQALVEAGAAEDVEWLEGLGYLFLHLRQTITIPPAATLNHPHSGYPVKTTQDRQNRARMVRQDHKGHVFHSDQ